MNALNCQPVDGDDRGGRVIFYTVHEVVHSFSCHHITSKLRFALLVVFSEVSLSLKEKKKVSEGQENDM